MDPRVDVDLLRAPRSTCETCVYIYIYIYIHAIDPRVDVDLPRAPGSTCELPYTEAYMHV